jgi:hypothetical protein
LNVEQGQKFVAVMKAKNRRTAISQNAKNRGIVAARDILQRHFSMFVIDFINFYYRSSIQRQKLVKNK